ncbi:hypothetical protein Bca52824_062506 [Brassica carinata]|uniref:Uncharacterized protein n=1 Tax=Brassica carinata TaxID=52824 RepID=A0A8X7U9H1_BRACI|nr:hypothetical protein Bca52824_062506 [Brassica carinata]
MARVRKLTISQSERYLGSSYSFGGSNGNSVTDESELTEEDVWSHAVDHSPEDTPESFGAWSSRDAVMGNGRVCGGLSLAFEDILEKVCEELVTRIDDLKAETRRKWDETEEEMQMLQMAELWREESVRVKLMDSKLSLEEKYEEMN